MPPFFGNRVLNNLENKNKSLQIEMKISTSTGKQLGRKTCSLNSSIGHTSDAITVNNGQQGRHILVERKKRGEHLPYPGSLPPKRKMS